MIGDRSFGDDPELVGRLGVGDDPGAAGRTASRPAPSTSRATATPTSTRTSTCPSVDHSRSRLDEVELRPFRKAIEAGVATVMTSHVLVREIDDALPATLSPEIVTGPPARRSWATRVSSSRTTSR